jgi:hypothetical protein
MHGEMGNAHNILVGKPNGMRPLRRHWPTWEDIIKMDVKETGDSVDWIHMAQDRDWWQTLVNTFGSIKGKEFLD